MQVIANGLAPMIMAMLYSITVNEAFLVGYVAALAEALADTCASGIGAFSKTAFDPFKMKRVKCGLSGGMSLIGTVASFVGAAVVSVVAFAFGALNLKFMLIALICAFIGAIFDSFLGSVFQIKYKCKACSEVTEKEFHCGKHAEKYCGFSFFDNDVVNLLSGFFASIAAVTICLIL